MRANAKIGSRPKAPHRIWVVPPTGSIISKKTENILVRETAKGDRDGRRSRRTRDVFSARRREGAKSSGSFTDLGASVVLSKKMP